MMLTLNSKGSLVLPSRPQLFIRSTSIRSLEVRPLAVQFDGLSPDRGLTILATSPAVRVGVSEGGKDNG